MKVPYNKFVIAVESEFIEETQIAGQKIIVPAVGEHVEDWRRTKGTVKVIPSAWKKNNATFVKNFGEMMFDKDFEPYCREIKPGDTVHFSAIATKQGTWLGNYDDGAYYVVDPHLLIAIERDGELIPVAYRCLVQPKMVDNVQSKLLLATGKTKRQGVGIIYRAQGMLEEFNGHEVTYDEKYTEWVEINGKRFDAPYVSDISSVQLMIK